MMVASYAHHIAPWMDGTESLPDGEYRVYHVVCQLIYLNNGPIILHESGIAGRCNQHVLAFRRYLAKLVERQKLMIGSDGKLSNRRAESELKSRMKPAATPLRPPPDPPPTPSAPPRGGSAKPLKSGKSSTGTPQPSCESSLLTFLPDSQIGNQEVKKKRTVLVEGRHGSRMTRDAVMPDESRQYAIDNGLDPVRTWEEFVDYWIGIPGQRGIKLDWPATFRNRIRDIIKRHGGGQHGQSRSGSSQLGFSGLAAKIRATKSTVSNE